MILAFGELNTLLKVLAFPISIKNYLTKLPSLYLMVMRSFCVSSIGLAISDLKFLTLLIEFENSMLSLFFLTLLLILVSSLFRLLSIW